MARNSQHDEALTRQMGARPASKKLTPLRALKPFIMPYRGMIAAAGAALIVAAMATLVLPAAVRGVIVSTSPDAPEPVSLRASLSR